jgi:predicted DNA-binding transcriptional regulator YafY
MTARHLIEYIDKDGVITRRTVQIIRFTDTLLVGRCELRDDIRTFALRRVQHAYDADTGEVLFDRRKANEPVATG